MSRFKRNPFLSFEAAVPQDDLLDVVVLDEIEPARAKPRSRALSGRPWGTWTVALGLTVIAHALLVGSLALGTGKRASRPPDNEGFQGMGRNADGLEPVSVLILIPDKSIHAPEDESESPYMSTDAAEQPDRKDVALASTDLGSIAIQPPSLEDFDVSASVSTEAEGDGGEAALLFGRYMGQIKARIERAWSYPTAPSKQRFQCKAQIRQSREGSVQEVTLQQCGTDSQWQMSLVRAIQDASPLSAPPSEKIFTEVVTLNFAAQAPEASARVVDSVARNVRQK